jgi:hypothetical protein
MRLPWSRPKPSAPVTPADWMQTHAWLSWEAPRNYVAGEASYRQALSALTGVPCESGYCRPVLVRCEREPGNRYDANAIRAIVNGQHVGYLRRHLASQLAPPLDRAQCNVFIVPGLLRGGSMTAPHVGCHIWLGRPVEPEGLAFVLPSEAEDREYLVPWPVQHRERPAA